MEVLPGHVLERVQVPARPVARLCAGDVEADHPVIAVLHGQLGNLERPGSGPHRGQQGVDPDRPTRTAGCEALEHRLYHFVQAQPGRDMQFRREPNLRVHHAVSREVLGALRRHPDQRVTRLHHPDGVLERFEVQLEVAVLGSRGADQAAEFGWIAGGQALVPVLLGELNDRRRAQPAVQVIVQQHLGYAADLIKGRRHADHSRL